MNRFVVAEKSYLRSLHVMLVCYMNPMTSPDTTDAAEAEKQNGVPIISPDDIKLVSSSHNLPVPVILVTFS